MKKSNHYIGLDLLRGVSGYGVAVTHFFAFMYNSEVSEYISFLFVEFFFVLSGFVLFPQILKIYNITTSTKSFSLGKPQKKFFS